MDTIKDKKLVVFLLLIVILAGGLVFFVFHPTPSAKKTVILLSQDINGFMKACNYIEPKCTKDLAKHLLEEYSLRDILSHLQKEQSKIYTNFDCHRFTHYLGQYTYEKENDFPSTLEQCSNYCGSGCYHGVAEKYFATKYGSISNITIESLSLEIAGVCKENDKTKVSQQQCDQKEADALHGLGHALMFLTNNDLPQSLHICDGANRYANACYDGVFMDNVFTKDHPSRFFNVHDPLFPCTILEEKYKRDCYKNQAINFSGIMPVKDICQKFPEIYKKDCYEAAGKGHTSPGDLKSLSSNCDEIEEAIYKSACIKGVFHYLIGIYGEDLSPIISFCKVNEHTKKDCFEELIGYSVNHPGENASIFQNICVNLPSPWNQECMKRQSNLH